MCAWHYTLPSYYKNILYMFLSKFPTNSESKRTISSAVLHNISVHRPKLYFINIRLLAHPIIISGALAHVKVIHSARTDGRPVERTALVGRVSVDSRPPPHLAVRSRPAGQR